MPITTTLDIDKTELKSIFAAHLRALQKTKGISHQQAGGRFGVSDRQWRRWVSSTDLTYPPHHLLLPISEYFGVRIDDLFNVNETNIVHSNEELNLIKAIRKSPHNRPYGMILQSLILLISDLNSGDRKAWLEIGRRLADARRPK